MFGSRKALLKQSSYTGARGDFSPASCGVAVRPQDASVASGDRVQVSAPPDALSPVVSARTSATQMCVPVGLLVLTI